MREFLGFLFWVGMWGLFALPPFAGSLEAYHRNTKITLISLYDNYQVKPGLKTDWGFSTLVKIDGEVILFDTGGDAQILLYNMKKLGIEPASIKKVIISHIHSDHLGGLMGFLEKNSDVQVFIPLSFPESVKNRIRNAGAQLVEVSGPVKITDCVYTTGELPGPPEEQSLIIDSPRGLVIITGCAHPGILNIVRKAREFMEKKEVYLVLGGFHHPRLEVVRAFRVLGVKKVAPSHCTGERQREAFKKEFGDDFIPYGVGRIVEIY